MIHSADRPVCPYCRSARVVRNGCRKLSKLYKCRGCSRQFRSTGAIQGLRFPPELIGSALVLYYQGASLAQVVARLVDDWDYAPLSRETIARWVRVYTAVALRNSPDLKVQTEVCWLVATLEARVGSDACWVWLVMDLQSRYILACDFSPEKDVDLACEVLKKAKACATTMPIAIATDGNGPCDAAVRTCVPRCSEDPFFRPYRTRSAAGVGRIASESGVQAEFDEGPRNRAGKP